MNDHDFNWWFAVVVMSMIMATPVWLFLALLLGWIPGLRDNQ